MFKQLVLNNYVKILQENALPIIISEHNKNNEIYEFIAKFISNNNLLVSDTDLLLGKKLYWENIEIYDTDANKTANVLVKQLCETFGQHFVLKILEIEYQYAIEYNISRLCSITNFNVYKKYSIKEFISPVTVVFNNASILLMPPLLEIISLYKNLYNPHMAEDWNDILLTITQLEVFADTEFKKILTNKLPNLSITPETCDDNTSKFSKQNIKKSLLDFIADTNYLVLEHTIKNDNVLVIISQNNIEYDFNHILSYIGKITTFGVVYKQKELHVPNEFLMEKIYIYLTYNNGTTIVKKHILTVCNNLSYELINFTKLTLNNNTYKIVDPITEIRIIYINIWEYITSRRNVKKIKFNNDLTDMLTYLIYYKKMINISEYKENYTGVYIDVNISKKIKLLSAPKLGKSTYFCFDI